MMYFECLRAFRIHAGRGTDGHEVGRARARIAKGPLANSGAKLVEKGIADVEAVEDAFGAEIAVGQDGGRSELIDNLGPATPDCVHRLVPTDTFELAAAFRPRALKRMEQSLRAVDPLLIVVDLHA